MNTPRKSLTHRLMSVTFAAFITLSVVGGIDGLARQGVAADSLLAQLAASVSLRG